ncbi:MAG: hypothetical protein BEN18_04065 [Epulopiscium sp. Nuni2H_MBin001]|nr:MAG: hypothetical protein BEN18_04065 [Epulopiscium sp. Nuni2H_MBin001]
MQQITLDQFIPTNEWKVDLNTIDYEGLLKNRISRDFISPSDIPQELCRLLYKDICFKSAFGVVRPTYNPVKNICALLNTVLRAAGINFQLNPDDIDVSPLPTYSSLVAYTQHQKKLFEEEIHTNVLRSRTSIPDIQLVSKNAVAVTEIQTTVSTDLWDRIFANQSAVHSISQGKGYSIWLLLREFPEEYRNTPITISGYHTSTIKVIGDNVSYTEPVDRSGQIGNVITVDLFHPDLYKISKELALWAHFILTGDNPGKNIYMDDILAGLAKLDKY